MLDQDDLKWIATNLTELNRVLQQASRHSVQARKERENGRFLQLLSEEVEEARRTAQALFDRLTLQIHAAVTKAPSGKTPQFRVLPPHDSSPQHSSPKTSGTLARNGNSSASVADRPAITNPHGHGALIMIVDDDAEVLERASAMLEEEDFRVLMAKDGFEALQFYRTLGREISLIILDFFLPVMDGDAVFDELKALDPRVQVVLSSGFAEQTKLGAMLARGLCGFIPKPYTSEKLLDQVRSIIAA